MDSASPPAPIVVDNYQNAQEGIWPNGPVQLARGRQAKDPNAKTVAYNVTSLEEFESSLREYLRSPKDSPEHTECQFTFWIGASFLVQAPQQPSSSHPSHPSQPHSSQQHPSQAPPGYRPAVPNSVNQYAASRNPPHTYQSVADPAIALTLPTYPHVASNNGGGGGGGGGGGQSAQDKHAKIPMSIHQALQPTSDPKEKMRKQRAIAKCCIDSIQRIDGFRYSFHNCWNSREDDSFRFSYYCNDSLLNKDRAANGKGAKLGKRATKPVYDCKGVLSVKFSAVKSSLDVHYKHVPIHKTYEERAPPPRKDSKRRKFLEENDPEALIRIANRPRLSRPPDEQEPNQDQTRDQREVTPKPKKKKTKKDDEPKSAANSIESDLRAQSLRSLLELIQTDPDPQPAPPSVPQPRRERDQSRPAVNHTDERPARPTQPPPQPQQPPRKRPRNSCDICKAKKTKCDGTRPVCNTCIDKNRQCFYSETLADNSQQLPSSVALPAPSEPARPVQAVTNELSELERMKKELEEAKARIHQLESEKTHPTTTPQQTPKVTPRRPPSQTQNHQQNQPQAPPAPNPPTQQHLQQQPQQIQTAQQMQNSQFGHYDGNATVPQYGINRQHPSQNQAPHQLHTSSGLAPTQESNNPYNRQFGWPQYFGYQSAQQQQQQPDQWAAATRGSIYRP